MNHINVLAPGQYPTVLGSSPGYGTAGHWRKYIWHLLVWLIMHKRKLFNGVKLNFMCCFQFNFFQPWNDRHSACSFFHSNSGHRLERTAQPMQETPQMPVGRLNTYDDITNRSPIGIEGKNKPARWKAGLPRHGMFQCYSIPVKRFSAWITNWWIIITTKKHPQNEKYEAMPTSWQNPPWASFLILHILRLLTGISPNRASCPLTSSSRHLDVGNYSRLLLSPADLDHPELRLHPVKICAYFWGAWQLSKELLPFARKIYLQPFFPTRKNINICGHGRAISKIFAILKI